MGGNYDFCQIVNEKPYNMILKSCVMALKPYGMAFLGGLPEARLLTTFLRYRLRFL